MIKVKIAIPAFQKLKLYIANVDDEVSGLAYVKADKEILYVYDVILLPQVVSVASTSMIQKSIAQYLDDRIKNNLPIEDIHGWFHSHAEMDTFWSATDVATIEDFDTEREDNNWLLSMVGNQEGKLLCRLDIFSPLRITLDDLPWEISLSPNKELVDSIKAEIKEKVNNFCFEEEEDLITKKMKRLKKQWFGKKKGEEKTNGYKGAGNNEPEIPPALPGEIYSPSGERIFPNET